jgi:hypothetical protein
VDEEKITHLAEPINMPMPVSRRALHEHKDRYYGEGKSLAVYVGDSLVYPSRIAVFDLSDDDEKPGFWRNIPLDPDFDTDGPDWVAVDPELGRIVFLKTAATGPVTTGPVTVTYHYGFSADIGGGEYEREATFESSLAEAKIVQVKHNGESVTKPIQDGLDSLGASDGTVEIVDGWTYEGSLAIGVSAGQRVELRAANGCRPLLRLVKENLDQDNLLEVGDPAKGKGEVILNGLVLVGGTIKVNDGVTSLRLRHCTVVPSRDKNGQIGPGLQIAAPGVAVEIDHCIILGGIEAIEGSRVNVSDSIVDAMGETAPAFGPFTPNDTTYPPGWLRATNSTFIGLVHTELMELASNTVFLARSADTKVPPVWCDRLQEGCVRFCFVPDGSRVPRQYRCQPELALKKRADELGSKVSDLPTQERERIVGRIQPALTSVHFGDYSYGQLGRLCPEEIGQGADDGAEMGAFHDLYQPQREANLRIRLQEYLRFGLVAGIFYET